MPHLAALVVFLLVSSAPAAASAQKCQGTQLVAAGKHYDCVIAAQSKAVKKTGKIASPGEPKCGEVLTKKWAKAVGFGGCPSGIEAGGAIEANTQQTEILTDTLAPGAPAVSKCSAVKLRGASKYFFCRLKVHRADVLKGKPVDFAKCDAKLTSAFAKAEAAGDCLTSADLESARTQVTGHADFVEGMLAGAQTTTTAPTGTTTTTLESLDDTFDGVALDPSWTVLNGSVTTLSVSGGQLHLQIDTLTNWFDTFESVLVYKQVTGDFDVHATLHASKTSNTADEPDPEYRLGGLLARDPASTPADSNFVHVALGSGPVAIPFSAEDKTTDDSSSAYTFHAIAGTEGELRLTRAGATFSMYYRPIGDPTWQLLGTHVRADLPATLQVGMMAYDFNGAPDLTVSFDEIVFE